MPTGQGGKSSRVPMPQLMTVAGDSTRVTKDPGQAYVNERVGTEGETVPLCLQPCYILTPCLSRGCFLFDKTNKSQVRAVRNDEGCRQK